MFLGVGHTLAEGFVRRRTPSEVQRRGPPAWRHAGHRIKAVGAGGMVRLHVVGLFWLCKHTDTPVYTQPSNSGTPGDLSTATLHGDAVLALPRASSEPTVLPYGLS